MATKKDGNAATAAAAAPAATALARTGGGGSLAKYPVADASNYQIVAMGGGGDLDDITNALAENLGGATLSAFDFQRIRVPSGGGIAWEVMDPETAEVVPAATFDGIVVSFHDQKAFWAKSLDEGNPGPPDCSSTDCVQGHGKPGILCANCPNNVFGSAKGGKGRGKACKDVRFLFVCRPGDILPELVPIPPTSLKGVRNYFLRLATNGIPFWRAITRFKLVKDKSADGIVYARVDCECVGVLSGEAISTVRGYSASIKKMLGAPSIPVKPADFTGGQDDMPGGVAATSRVHSAGRGAVNENGGGGGEVIEGQPGDDANRDRSDDVM